MPTNISGSNSTKTESVTRVAGPGNHQIELSVATGRQETTDDNWNGAALTLWGVGDTVEGSGPGRGYFQNVHANGDIDYGTTGTP